MHLFDICWLAPTSSRFGYAPAEVVEMHLDHYTQKQDLEQAFGDPLGFRGGAVVGPGGGRAAGSDSSPVARCAEEPLDLR